MKWVAAFPFKYFLRSKSADFDAWRDRLLGEEMSNMVRKDCVSCVCRKFRSAVEKIGSVFVPEAHFESRVIFVYVELVAELAEKNMNI